MEIPCANEEQFLSVFGQEVVQAINDWQRGGDHDQKVRRGARLKEVCSDLPPEFRSCDVPCFRQEAHEKARVWQLLADERLPETIAAWTTDINTAKQFKGGVPPEGLQGVIFGITPQSSSVVVNLNAVYRDPGFRKACEQLRRQLTGFDSGIGKYGPSQNEVVLEIANLTPEHVLHYGGFSSSREEIAEMLFNRQPTEEDLEVLDRLCAKAGTKQGAWWLSASGSRAVLDRMKPRIEKLRNPHNGGNFMT
jgi:hypothetical protein